MGKDKRLINKLCLLKYIVLSKTLANWCTSSTSKTIKS